MCVRFPLCMPCLCVSYAYIAYSCTFLSAGECKVTQTGQEYRGTLSKTRSNYICQAWSSQQPHSHGFTPQIRLSAGLVNNYCRNPDNEPNGPWCYTTSVSKRWEYCNVLYCGKYGLFHH